jgi:hypothetical protein
MARARIILAAVLAVAALAVLAGPAAASAPAANTKFCKAANKPTKSQAKAAIRGFKNAAKYAPKKVRSAMSNVAKYLGLVANASNPSDLAQVYTSGDYKNYAKSITTYVTYYAQQCSGV